MLATLSSLKERASELASRLKIGCIADKEDCFKIDPIYPGVTFRRITDAVRGFDLQPGRPCVISLSLDFLESLYEASALPRYVTLLISEVQHFGCLVHITLRSGSPLTEKIESLSAVYLKLAERDGSLFVYSSKPFSPLYGLVAGRDGFRLVPVM